MAITIGSTTLSAEMAGSSSFTTSHTVASGTDLLVCRLPCSLWTNNPITWASVTFNGSNMTYYARQVSSSAQYKSCELWYMLAPAVTTANVIGTITGGYQVDGAPGITNISGCNITTPFGTAVGADGNGTAVSVTVSTGANDYALDCVLANAATGMTCDGSQTQDFKNASGFSGGSSKVAGTTMAWTTVSSDIWISLAVPVLDGGPPASRIVRPNRLRPAIFSPGIAR